MPFPPEEHQVKGVGPTVQRLEQIGIDSLHELARASVGDIVTAVAGQLGSTCWKNSPQARAAIQAAIDLAKSRQ
ncbi:MULTISPECIES: helix-hairpin-helix domain-containing protein [unclassified Pseudomonas]|uniref:helix-hairpin-helix domain-containing protein n=1 Tax=unclassified Pseudomonas TaxID=196821 RepID=UPI0023B972EB|nr:MULTISPECIES: helix-hairpin-helix domain-containing protein [unclassified Pseudomonas]